MNYDNFLWFIEERESIRKRKDAGLPQPWTEDHVLHNTRFCNIDRYHDAGTKRLLDFIEEKNLWEKVYYTVLYRAALSSQRFLDCMTGIWMHDYRNLKYLEMNLSDARKPYQVFLYKGDSVSTFLSNVASPVAKRVFEEHFTWTNASIMDVSQFIANTFNTYYRKRLIFLATEITKDLSYFLSIDPDSECNMNVGARLALKKLDGRRIDRKVEELLNMTNLNQSSLEHALCEWGRYLTRWNYYREHGSLKDYWLYRSEAFQDLSCK